MVVPIPSPLMEGDAYSPPRLPRLKVGIPGDYENPGLTEAYERTIAACRNTGEWNECDGLHVRRDLVQKKFCEMGVDWVMAATDGLLLLSGATKRAGELSALNEKVSASRSPDGKMSNGTVA